MHHRHALVVLRFGEGVFQRRAAVADPVRAHILRAVEMAQRHIVEVLKHGGVHVVAAAHRQLFGLAGGRAGDKLVGQQHVALRGVHRHAFQRHADGVGIAFDGLVRRKAPDMGGLKEGQQPEMHRPVFVAEGDGGDVTAVDRGDVDAAGGHQPPAEGQPFGTVMVAADDQHRDLPLGQAAQKVVKQRYRLRRGHAFVVYVAGDEHGVRLFLVDDGCDLVQNVGLVLQHGHLVDPLADVQVR